MRKTLFLPSTLLGLVLAAPGFAQTGSPSPQTGTESHQGTDRSGSAAPDHTAGGSSYTGHGRMGNKSLGGGNDSGKGGPSENAGSGTAGGASSGTRRP